MLNADLILRSESGPYPAQIWGGVVWLEMWTNEDTPGELGACPRKFWNKYSISSLKKWTFVELGGGRTTGPTPQRTCCTRQAGHGQYKWGTWLVQTEVHSRGRRNWRLDRRTDHVLWEYVSQKYRCATQCPGDVRTVVRWTLPVWATFSVLRRHRDSGESRQDEARQDKSREDKSSRETAAR